jgi:hypothetical protein
MNRTRKGRTLHGSGILSAIKKPFYGSKNPIYKLDVSESISFNKDKYEIAGILSYDVSDFSGFRAQSYIDQYLKKDIIEHALKMDSNAVKIVGYKVIHRPLRYTYGMCFGHKLKKTSDDCLCSSESSPAPCPGSRTVIGLVLRPIAGSVGTRRLTMSRPKSKSKSKTKTN